ncbi:MAG TPA: L,D-transpeptidase family protein [Flavipsychrobacter sp.]|nr:L,D-transpeptidase family protein [Flavipsychrobacter sp.]
MKKQLYLSLLLVITLLQACDEIKTSSPISNIFKEENKLDFTGFSDTLKAALANTSTIDSNKAPLSVNVALSQLYQENLYQPLWLSEDSGSVLLDSVYHDLCQLSSDGISTERYHLKVLQELILLFKQSQQPSISSLIKLDTTITHQYLKAARDLMFGLLIPRKADSLWFHANDSSWAIQSILPLLKSNQYPSLKIFRSELPYYKLLQHSLQHYAALDTNSSFLKLKEQLAADASAPDSLVQALIQLEAPWLTSISDTLNGVAAQVQSYQQYLGIKRTGKIDSTTFSFLIRSPSEVTKIIDANLERMRWLPQAFEQDYIVVNIPTMNFSMMRSSQEVMAMNVVVGKPSRQTPILNAMMSNVVINPPWGVPPTIAKNDVLPGLLRSGEAYLRKKGLDAYDHKGNKVSASTITASNYKRYMFRQPPGRSNALGYVKFNFPNKWDIYMHDTPHREDFDKFDRARSSGCVRLQRPQELAIYILDEKENKNFQQEKLDSLIRTRKTKYELLKDKIPVHIVYFTAWQDASGEHVRFARDFYKKDAKLMEMLSKY